MNNRLYFCTLFDSNYLTRGLVMYESLKACCKDFHLYIFSFDDRSFQVLKSLNLEKVTLISLSEFEDEELLRVKPTRSRAEYCWTCTSSTILYCLEQFHLPHCTYIDADLYFYQDPSILLDEMGEHSILITEHRYSPQYEKSAKAGKYCVQFITFRRDEYGMKALKWWRERCLEWCYARLEDGKFGDQKYLDDWPERFEKVWVLQHPGGGLAAWNIQQYEVIPQNSKFICRNYRTGQVFKPIFYHFHYLRYYSNGSIELGRRKLSKQVLQLIYLPYICKLENMKQNLLKRNIGFDPNGPTPPPSGIKHLIVEIYRRIKGTYHVYPLQKFTQKCE
ncbi:glycosyl transferase [Thermoflavifilum thermophilum]|uniref:Glycosyl transferase n=1 Tax=Thermoflavifilum thermophilum TaxID=1393122 RepID=A0A1I7MYJ8_9BACT|nr:glycosyl transferase [Thermoflavifilum thermophilum]SFV27490.1 hypothetical protein SAMN05660895_0124 [Thermoflavifilum thermophilum]